MPYFTALVAGASCFFNGLCFGFFIVHDLSLIDYATELKHIVIESDT